MSETLEIIFVRTWWQYMPEDGQWFTTIYHWFNILEAFVWIICASLVLHRYLANRKSPLEICYAFTFLTFAITDFKEAWQQSSWLIWLKLLNLIVLFMLRHRIMKRHYPAAKLY